MDKVEFSIFTLKYGQDYSTLVNLMQSIGQKKVKIIQMRIHYYIKKVFIESLNGIFWQGDGPHLTYANVLGEPNSGYCFSKTIEGTSVLQQSCKDKAFTGCKKEVLGGKIFRSTYNLTIW